MIEDAEKVAYSKKEEQLLKERETQVWDWPWHAYKKYKLIYTISDKQSKEKWIS